jgi:glycosyltransferase involved in cell wall biosynthesis
MVSDANLGFGGGCNAVARTSEAEYLIFLNDDVLVDRGWLDALVRAADADVRIAAVGSRIRFADGTLQEAGSIVWSDGTTMPIGRGLDAGGTAWRFRRDVTYCSACALLVRRADFEAVGGFDEAYYPAYYEDVDLCLKLAQRSKRVVYEPRAELVHFESQSSTSAFKSFLFRRNHRRFALKWGRVLEALFEPPYPTDAAAVGRAVRRARGPRTPVLLIDDRLPDATVGSGFGRTVELIGDIFQESYDVHMYASGEPNPDPIGIGAFEVEVVMRPLEEELREFVYEICIISRPHNFERFAPLIRKYQPACKICYDVESLFYRRLEKQAKIEPDPSRRQRLAAEAARGLELESSIARSADRLVCISMEERDILERVVDHAPIDFILPVARSVRPSQSGFGSREALAIFVSGWMAGPDSPNADGFIWFCKQVLPHLRAIVPHARVLATGGSPPANVLALAEPSVVIGGFVADLAAVYDRARVAISPIRFGAGVKIKTIEAMQFGIPVVATTVGAEGLSIDYRDAVDITDDAETFAKRIAVLMTNETAWETRRAATIDQMQAWAGRASTSWADVCRSMVGTAREAQPVSGSGEPTER